MRLHGGTLPLRAENAFVAPHGQPARHRFIRQIWPTGMPIQWRATGLFQSARVRTTRRGTELIFDQTDVDGPEVPADAPPRFQLPAWLQVTQYQNWGEISALLFPSFRPGGANRTGRASAPGNRADRGGEPGSEGADDGRATARAGSGTLFRAPDGDGNVLPATAEQSWSRRFADCKGKVALLLALLRNLGIEAEPVLVNAALGDGLAERLPMMAWFNHVIVRARIGGRSYWLDGTRAGDRNLDDLASSTFNWGLPLRASGAELEPFRMRPPASLCSKPTPFTTGPAACKDRCRFEWSGFQGGVGHGVASCLISNRPRRVHQASSPGRERAARHEQRIDLSRFPRRSRTRYLHRRLCGRTQINWARAPGSAGQRFRFSNDMISWDVARRPVRPPPTTATPPPARCRSRPGTASRPRWRNGTSGPGWGRRCLPPRPP